MKYVYELRFMEYSNLKGMYFQNKHRVFSSRKKATKEAFNVIEINKGTDVNVGEIDNHKSYVYDSLDNQVIDYNCLSVDNNPMKLRLVICKMKLN